jgi:hypothetical protein
MERADQQGDAWSMSLIATRSTDGLAK